MISAEAVLELHDLDLLMGEARDPESQARLKRLGLAIEAPRTLELARRRLLDEIEPRWLVLYERAQRRYGRAVAAVRARVCQGCYMALPRSAAPAAGETLSLCESCGRILYWA